MRFVFQESLIWEHGDPVDPRRPQKVIKAKSEPKARRLLPKPDTGRTWVLVEKRSGVSAAD